MMLRSKLFIKVFSGILLSLVLFFCSVYWFSVPIVKKAVFEMEENNGRAILNHTYEEVETLYGDIESFKTAAREAHKRELKDIVSVAQGYIQSIELRVKSGALGRAQAEKEILEAVRHFRYGKNDYVWISDYDSVLISHPDPALYNSDFSKVRDVHGDLIVPPMVDGARKNGDGFYSYWWRRLGEETPSEKLTYYRNMPDWKWVMGTGVYIDDINKEVERRKAIAIERLRRLLHETRIANTGYVYIFDAKMNMIIHPNSNIEGTNIADLLDPVTHQLIAKELIEASSRPDHKLIYKWDKPTDPGDYRYEKISWVRHFDGLDWYIASSVYVDELQRTSTILKNSLLWLALAALVLLVVGGYLFLYKLIAPIKELSDTALRVSQGELDLKFSTARRDEVGTLAEAFNSMVQRLKDQIGNLEHRVAERTAELTDWVRQLERRNKEIAVMRRMGDLLQACQDIQETYPIVLSALEELFPLDAGALYMIDPEGHELEMVGAWGNGPRLEPFFAKDQCWAMRRGTLHEVRDAQKTPPCAHVHEDQGAGYMCLPIIAQGEVLGMLHIRDASSEKRAGVPGEADLEARRRLAVGLAEHIALALANLRLRETLRRQSVRDPLTGLYNRRYLEESLIREERRAIRHQNSLGVLMLDVDNFKRFNDAYGHDAGDKVLKGLARIIRQRVRGEDIACRYGGEEFTLLLQSSGVADCEKIAEELRETVAHDLEIRHRGQVLSGITISVGVAVYPDHGATVVQTLHTADMALYQAKTCGRNRVITGDRCARPSPETNRRTPPLPPQE